MVKICDNKSVGMLIWRSDKILLIERKRPPFGFAPPAGHVDEDNSFEAAAIRELQEEVGLTSNKLQLLIEGRKNNPCRRHGGSWHHWKIYKVEAEGEVNRSFKETKQVNWYNQDSILNFAARTEDYLRGIISEEEWQNNPGLEPVWLEWFKELKII